MILRISGITKQSVVDGPGLRFVVFTQGCPRRCPGCHNPSAQPFAGGYEITVEEILREIEKIQLLSGITLTGGEPFSQAAACATLAELVHKMSLNVITYSGYYYSELLTMAKKDPAIKKLLQSTDILIDGPYDETQKDLNLPFRGSKNQSIIYLNNSSL